MPFDAIIANPGRLRILTALASEPRQEFVRLRGVTQMTDGNLATHARRLHSAGMLAIDKTFRAGKPVTTFILTEQGRKALQTHVQNVLHALQPRATSEPTKAIDDTPLEPQDSDWID
jgi:DNA-binding MarR family transcriptional regulator